MSLIANRVLIVDDEVAVGDFLVRVAAGRGYEAKAVSNASDFQDRLGDWKPGRILLDLQMPGTDGIEILRALAEAKCSAEIVIMSGFDEKVIESARRLGEERGLKISATIRKPFRIDEVENALSIPEAATDEIDVQAIERAIDRSEFCLFFQPKVDLAGTVEGGSVTRYKTLGFEGLMRWNHPTRGLLGPLEFLPLAESAGMMDRITEVVIGLALAQQRAWLDDELQTSLAINISAQNLRDAGFADHRQDLAIALPRQMPAFPHQARFVGAADQRQSGGAGYSKAAFHGGFTIHTPGRHRAREAVQLVLAGMGELEQAAQQSLGRLADNDAVG